MKTSATAAAVLLALLTLSAQAQQSKSEPGTTGALAIPAPSQAEPVEAPRVGQRSPVLAGDKDEPGVAGALSADAPEAASPGPAPERRSEPGAIERAETAGPAGVTGAIVTPPLRTNQQIVEDIERDKLARALEGARTPDELKQRIERQGFTVSAVNAENLDEVEYEVVKEQNSYEVMAELDDDKRIRNVEVSENLWQADATERALERRTN